MARIGIFDTGGFKRQYPPKGALTFDGGLNNKFEISLIRDNESPDCRNVVFNEGSVATRQGVTKLNTTPVSGGTFTGIYVRRDNDGISETMCVFAGANMFTLGGTTFSTVPSAQSVFISGNRVGAAQMENYLFMGQSGITAHKWDGSLFTLHGIPAPTVTHSVVSNGVGALTASGQYQYRITYRNSALVEGDMGPVSSTFVISVTSGQNRITSIPCAPISFGVSARRVYRNANGSTVFKLVGTIADNSTTTFDDNVADSALGAVAPSDNGVPPPYSIIVYHKSRLFMNDVNNPNFIWWTDLNNPYVVGSTNFETVGDNSTDLLKSISIYGDSIVCNCENSATLLYMPSTDDTTWQKIKLRTPYGTKSPHCSLNINNKLLTAAVENGKFVGFGAISGTAAEVTVSNISYFAVGSLLKTNQIEPDMFQIQESYLGNISGIVFKNKAYITVPYGSGQTTNNRIYLYDFTLGNLTKSQEGAWVPWTGLSAEQFAIYSGNLYYISSSTGYVYKMESGVYSDDGQAIDSYYWTKEFPGLPSEFNMYKDWRWGQFLVEQTGNWFMNIRYRTDSDIGGGNTRQISLAPGGAIWNAFNWGGVWGGGVSKKEQRVYFDGIRGKRIQLRFDNQNTVNQWFKVHRANLFYNLKGPR